MIALPIPLMFALVLLFLLARSLREDLRPTLFSALLFFCAFQGGLISLVQYYGVTSLRFVQPVTATIVPPLAWVTFQSTALRPFELRRDGVHLLVPAFTAFCAVFAPATLDAAVSGIFLAYGGAILIRLGVRSSDLPLVRLEAGPVPALIWKAVGAALIVSALTDTMIAVALVYRQAWLQPLIVSVFSSLALFAIGLLSLSKEAAGEPEPGEREAGAGGFGPDVEALGAQQRGDEELMARLNRLAEEQRPYLDPNLTLARLARKLQVPAKQLSATINRVTGDNVSRYINRFRIEHACRLLQEGETVTGAMLASGFNTKSNFNREFARVLTMSPSAWLAANNPKPSCDHLAAGVADRLF